MRYIWLSMIRFVFRFLGYVLIALGFALMIVDGTGSIAGSEMSLTSTGEAFATLAPHGLEAARGFVEAQLPSGVWPLIAGALAAIPAFASLLATGLVAIVLGRRPRPRIGFEPLQ